MTSARAAAATTTLSLPARTTPTVRALLGSPLLHELSHGLGGPYHVVLPDAFDANVAAFRSALSGVDSAIYYAKKANKATCWIERAAELGVGVDVAGAGELRAALGHGVLGENVVITGPAKSDELIRLGAAHGTLIAVDSLDELERVTARRGARVLLRCLPPTQPHSRFGLAADDLGEALRQCVRDGVRMQGFSVHLAGYDPQQRADAAGHLLGWIEQARALGLGADRISIGGGFAVDYVYGEDWYRFLKGHRTEDYHTGRRPDDFYPYHCPVAGADALSAVLASVPAGSSEPLAGQLRAGGVRLLLEPGRALLDQAGFTVFRVQGVKDRDYGILTVDGTSFSLSEQWFTSEFLPDPVLIPAHDRTAEPYAACVGGASCLESDMLTWRKIAFPFRPQVGDLLVYLNTAGYQMDSNESPFHELPLPPKVVVDADLRWRLDRRPT